MLGIKHACSMKKLMIKNINIRSEKIIMINKKIMIKK